MTLDGDTMDALGYGHAWSLDDGHGWYITTCGSSSRVPQTAAERYATRKRNERERLRQKLATDPAWAAAYRRKRSEAETRRQRALTGEALAKHRSRKAKWMAERRAKQRAA